MTHAMNAFPGNHATIRLNRLAPLSAEELAALERAATAPTTVAARREILAEGDPVRRPTLLLVGWACRVRSLRDGRRQILEFILPGELVGRCHHPQPRALSSVMALTKLTICAAPEAAAGSSLADAYAISAAQSEAGLLRQITRIGRLSALQRTADLLLDLHERLLSSGSAQPTSFPFPITQETLADALGLTSVHINRTLQTIRRHGLLTMANGMVHLPNPSGLRELIDYQEVDSGKDW